MALLVAAAAAAATAIFGRESEGTMADVADDPDARRTEKVGVPGMDGMDEARRGRENALPGVGTPAKTAPRAAALAFNRC